MQGKPSLYFHLADTFSHPDRYYFHRAAPATPGIQSPHLPQKRPNCLYIPLPRCKSALFAKSPQTSLMVRLFSHCVEQKRQLRHPRHISPHRSALSCLCYTTHYLHCKNRHCPRKPLSSRHCGVRHTIGSFSPRPRSPADPGHQTGDPHGSLVLLQYPAAPAPAARKRHRFRPFPPYTQCPLFLPWTGDTSIHRGTAAD